MRCGSPACVPRMPARLCGTREYGFEPHVSLPIPAAAKWHRGRSSTATGAAGLRLSAYGCASGRRRAERRDAIGDSSLSTCHDDRSGVAELLDEEGVGGRDHPASEREPPVFDVRSLVVVLEISGMPCRGHAKCRTVAPHQAIGFGQRTCPDGADCVQRRSPLVVRVDTCQVHGHRSREVRSPPPALLAPRDRRLQQLEGSRRHLRRPSSTMPPQNSREAPARPLIVARSPALSAGSVIRLSRRVRNRVWFMLGSLEDAGLMSADSQANSLARLTWLTAPRRGGRQHGAGRRRPRSRSLRRRTDEVPISDGVLDTPIAVAEPPCAVTARVIRSAARLPGSAESPGP